METICEEAYRLLKDIPEEKWIVGSFQDNEGRYCAIGHYCKLTNNPTFSYVDTKAFKLLKQTENFLTEIGDLEGNNIVHVNDGDFLRWKDGKVRNKKYCTIGPKQRVMILLKDAIEHGY